MLKVLYEDNHLIAVFKPAGMLVQGDGTRDACLMDEVKKYLKETYHKPGNVFLGLLHRLDRPVSGIVLFAKTSKGASRLSEQFRNHKVKKIYQALVEGELKKKEETLVNFLIKDEGKNKVKVFDTNVAGSLRAELSYKVVTSTPLTPSYSRGGGSMIPSLDKRGLGRVATLVEIELKTGRPHQIRVQFAHGGHPLVGDVKYGASAALPDKSIALCAVRLTFRLATTEEWKTVEVKPKFEM